MTELEYLMVLNLLPEIGFIRFNNLMKRFGSPKNIFKASRAQLETVEKIGPKIADEILNCDKEKTLKCELKLIDKYGVKAISCLDKDYPENLKEIYDPPIILYVKGDIIAEDKYAVAIVGSRNASRYGIATAERLGYELAARGFTVASGLARGIDASGHKGALKAKGRTLAVLGSGLAEVYPPEHLHLAEDIAKAGAVVSEFPMATLPYKDNFPRRNRIISGLSLGVVVVEAAKNSGALITADFALEQGRELFAVPGQARAMTSFGTNALIRQGARLVESADDIIEELSEVVKGHLKAADKKEGKVVLTAKLNGPEEKVFNAMAEEPKSVDEIVDEAALAASETLSCLTRLELKGLVERLPGKLYVRKA
ncbi:MAG: DNA-processing protein DprA [Candidatus Omnitrophota bacterium]|nr:DNA-processing protein DprA [Candidatus Omnitrophota bacterium]